MLINYREKQRLTRQTWREELAGMGITLPEVVEMVAGVIAANGESVVSCYHFRAPAGDPGAIVVCHNLGRGALFFGRNIQWGQWDETSETLTLEGSGEKISFEGKPVYEGDDGSCSLGNF